VNVGRHDADSLLDAALAQAVAQTPAGVSVAAVARDAGAPSGSVYHRFPSRAVLLGELWLRTIDRFQTGFLAALAQPDPCAAARDAAGHVVDWSQAHPDQARLLLHPRRDFQPGDWPEELTRRAAAQDRHLRAALRDLTGRLGGDPERVVVAVVDLPLAVVRRHLTNGGTLPTRAADLVRDCVDALLGQSTGTGESTANWVR
jgi:AcrR family transcriptional regulator